MPDVVNPFRSLQFATLYVILFKIDQRQNELLKEEILDRDSVGYSFDAASPVRGSMHGIG